MSVLETLVAAAVGVLAIGGSMWFGFRVSRSTMRALRERVAATNAVLAEVARRLGLASVVTPSYQHPVVGDVPAYAIVAGERGGFAVRVELVSDEDSGDFVITVTPRGEVRWPDIGRVKTARDGERFPALLPALAGLGDAAEEIRVEPTMLRAVVRDGVQSADLCALVDAALVLARALPPAP